MHLLTKQDVFVCPAGSYITGIETTSGVIVNQIRFTCTNPHTKQKTVSPLFGTIPGPNHNSFTSPFGFRSVNTVTGNYLDSIQFLGGSFPKIGTDSPVMDTNKFKHVYTQNTINAFSGVKVTHAHYINGLTFFTSESPLTPPISPLYPSYPIQPILPPYQPITPPPFMPIIRPRRGITTAEALLIAAGVVAAVGVGAYVATKK